MELTGLFNEIDRTLPSDTYENTYIDEGDYYAMDVLHLPKRSQNNTLNKVLVFVDSTLYSLCEYKIKRYAFDIYHVYGCDLTMKVIKGETCTDVKNLIINDSIGLDGVVFIGEIAPAWYEANDVINHDFYSTWPCDMYYMDLNAVWNNTDNDYYFDNYVGDFNPEIFVGRIDSKNVSVESEKLMLFEKYMDKNHAFWIGHRQVNKKFALSYTNATWNNSINDIINGIHYLYGQSKCDTITSNNALFCRNDYLERLRNNRYEFVQLASHSSEWRHAFDSLVVDPVHIYDTVSVYINNSKIYANEVKAIGMNLFCCRACRWTYNGYIGGKYVYSPNSSLLSLIGSTKVGSMLDMSDFYNPLHNAKTMGQAFVDWWQSDLCYSMNSDSILCWFFGLTIIGDPLVNFFHCTNSSCQDQVSLTSYNSSNSPLSYYLASESITVAPTTGSFTIPVGDHCILNAPTVEINGEFLCPQGSSMEILNEGCSDNCDE